jgi:hypothetical protein
MRLNFMPFQDVPVPPFPPFPLSQYCSQYCSSPLPFVIISLGQATETRPFAAI